jgi:AcrR family transcriptional regulator
VKRHTGSIDTAGCCCHTLEALTCKRMLMIGEHVLTRETATTGLRAELLDATVRLLHSVDPAGLTTRDIAREAGCSAGALYRHFATKADLLVAVAQERLRPDFGEMVSRVGSSTVERNLEHLVLSTQRFMTALVPIVTAVAADADLRAGWGRAFDRDDIPPSRTVRGDRCVHCGGATRRARFEAGVADDVREHAGGNVLRRCARPVHRRRVDPSSVADATRSRTRA